MRIVGWPEEPNKEGSLLPITITDVDLHGPPDELRSIARFLLKAAGERDFAQAKDSELNIGVELENSRTRIPRLVLAYG